MEFHWNAAILAEQSKRIVGLRVWQIRAGRTLIAYLVGKAESPAFDVDSAYPTPNDVRLVVEYALDNGWKSDERGANISLSSNAEITLAALRPIDPPARGIL